MTALRATALLTLAALAAGCQSAEDGAEPAAAPATSDSTVSTGTAVPATSAAPTPSGSPSAVTAANTDEVCRAVDKLILTGSKKIVADSADATRDEATNEELDARLKRTLSGLADGVRKQAARAEDPQIEALIRATAKQLDAGARSASPVKWMSTTFVNIPPKLARECRA
ncbi:hypothetical protein OOK41_30750 [Micromonospora sp. NBC_01655]|uniref:hypothetical protein n=1 Tax=Micromonospora sp. NBC_01655 TaxID=2975983 RepID=UPI00225C1C45|nr:hypothetical protein [Micromonospora sp. NBC_01655]MCX4474639.1 hypothetical protein [Micromonospora sp. NBC_01655]